MTRISVATIVILLTTGGAPVATYAQTAVQEEVIATTSGAEVRLRIAGKERGLYVRAGTAAFFCDMTKKRKLADKTWLLYADYLVDLAERAEEHPSADWPPAKTPGNFPLQIRPGSDRPDCTAQAF